MNVKLLIHLLSIILPFTNETAIILTNSKLKLFRHLYRSCVYSFDLKSKYLICASQDHINKIIIDLISYFGVILFIGKNTIQYGYVTGVSTGMVLVFWSVMIPTMYLHKIIESFVKLFNVKNPYLYIFIGIMCIIVLMIITNVCESIAQILTKGIKIDPITEKHIKK